MAMTVNNSTNGMNGRHLSLMDRQVRTSMERLTSGHRINDAADDAAGLAVAQLMASDVAGQQQAIRNATDGVSMTLVADGGMEQVSENLVRMRELATQASSDTLSDDQRSLVTMEYNALASENGHITDRTEMNGLKLLANADGMDIHLGTTEDGESQSITVPATDLTHLKTMTLDPDDPAAAMAELDAATEQVASARAEMGAVQNRLGSAIENMGISAENTTAAQSQISDIDIATEMAEFTRSMSQMQAGTAMFAQTRLQTDQVISLLS